MDTSVPVVLYVTPPGSRNNDEAYDNLPAIDFSAEMQESLNLNATIFKVTFDTELFNCIQSLSTLFCITAFNITVKENYFNNRGKINVKVIRFH